MADRGRVVVVAAGFALWTGGRCVAAARWSDIRRVHARRRDAGGGEALALAVELVDGSRVELHEEAPGFDAFAERAAAALPGLMHVGDWHHAVAAESGAGGVLLFERRARRY